MIKAIFMHNIKIFDIKRYVFEYKIIVFCRIINKNI